MIPKKVDTWLMIYLKAEIKWIKADHQVWKDHKAFKDQNQEQIKMEEKGHLSTIQYATQLTLSWDQHRKKDLVQMMNNLIRKNWKMNC